MSLDISVDRWQQQKLKMSVKYCSQAIFTDCYGLLFHFVPVDGVMSYCFERLALVGLRLAKVEVHVPLLECLSVGVTGQDILFFSWIITLWRYAVDTQYCCHNIFFCKYLQYSPFDKGLLEL